MGKEFEPILEDIRLGFKSCMEILKLRRLLSSSPDITLTDTQIIGTLYQFHGIFGSYLHTMNRIFWMPMPEKWCKLKLRISNTYHKIEHKLDNIEIEIVTKKK